MKVGFDFGDTVSRNPQMFGDLASSIISEGGMVFIIATIPPYTSQPRKVMEVRETRVPYNDIFILTWEKSKTEEPELKLDICHKLGLDMFFDDDKKVCDLLSLHGIQAFNYVKHKPKKGTTIPVNYS